jgi:two-component system chemotaxis response regulator CheY
MGTDDIMDIKILAVDDSPTMRRIIVNTLKRAGYANITEASDGREALARLKVEEFDFVITDWNMPEMDGLRFVSELRSDEKYRSLPVVMVTSRSVKEDILLAKEAGVNGYVVKPFAPEVLIEKVEQTLKPEEGDE